MLVAADDKYFINSLILPTFCKSFAFNDGTT